MTSTVDERGASGFTTSRPDNHAIFLRARRHSRVVRTLRLAIPIGSALLLAMIFLVSWLDPIRMLARLPTATGNLVISGSKITMEAPKLAGFTKDARAYELSARAAAQDITNPDVVELRIREYLRLTHFGNRDTCRAAIELPPGDGHGLVCLGVRAKSDSLTIRHLLHTIDIRGQSRFFDEERGGR